MGRANFGGLTMFDPNLSDLARLLSAIASIIAEVRRWRRPK